MNQHGAVGPLLERVRLGSDKGDPAVIHDDRFDRGGLVAFHGDDGAAGNDEVRSRDWGRVGRLLAAGGEHEGGGEDGGNGRAAGHGGFLGWGP